MRRVSRGPIRNSNHSNVADRIVFHFASDPEAPVLFRERRTQDPGGVQTGTCSTVDSTVKSTLGSTVLHMTTASISFLLKVRFLHDGQRTGIAKKPELRWFLTVGLHRGH